MKPIYNFIHGRFKNKTLREPYREIWVKAMYCNIFIVALRLFFGVLQFMSYISDMINYVFS